MGYVGFVGHEFGLGWVWYDFVDVLITIVIDVVAMVCWLGLLACVMLAVSGIDLWCFGNLVMLAVLVRLLWGCCLLLRCVYGC